MKTLFAPELRPLNERALVRTAAGIVIGGAYVRPPEPQSADAELMQRVYLAHDPADPHVAAMVCEPLGAAANRAFDQATRMVYVIAVLVLAWVLIGWVVAK